MFSRLAWIGFLWVGTSGAKPQSLESHFYNVCGRKVKLEIASTPDQRATGLMDRDGIPAGTGMLFVFEEPQKLYFWMKNVPFDIDIGFFDANSKLQKFLTMNGTSPMVRDDALPRYEGPENSVYAVELPKGFFRKTDSKGCVLKRLPQKGEKPSS